MGLKWQFMRFIFLLFFLILTSSSFAQTFITIQGKIVSNSNDLPVTTANIFIKRANIGAVSNENGDFIFHIPAEFASDTLTISSIGFKNVYYPISKYKPGESLIVSLKPTALVLDPVIVKSRNKKGMAQRLIKRAIDNMELNYPTDPFQMSGYYREYLRKKNTWSNVLEAAIEVEDKGFKTIDEKTSRVRLLQLRYNQKYRIDSSLAMPYDNNRQKFIPGAYIDPMNGNEFLILRSHDALRNYNRFTLSFLDYFARSFVKNHDFWIDSITYVNDVQLYSISFIYNDRYGYDSTDNFSARGHVMLRTDNYAIFRLRYETFVFNKDYDGRLYDLTLDYNEIDGKYYPQYIAFGNYFKIRNRLDTSTFALKQTVLRKSARILELHYNRDVDSVMGSDTSNFSIRYGKMKIPVKAISVLNNKVRMLLQIDTKTLNDLTGEGDLVVAVSELADKWGNRLAGKYTGYYQHREFFVNKIVSKIENEFPYPEVIPKTMPLYWNKPKYDTTFWDTFNAMNDRKLE